MVKVLIIILLMCIAASYAVLVYPHRNCKHIWTAEVKTVRKVARLTDAVIIYYADTDRLPPSLDDLLTPQNKDAGWQGPYIEAADLKDAWGRSIQYRQPGLLERPFDIWSFGKDGIAGGEADISSWEIGVD